MSDALTNPPSLGGSPGEPVPEVDPEDLRAIWQETRDLQAKHAGQNVAVGFDFLEAICKPGANAQAVWYRSAMIWVLNQAAQDQFAPWVRHGLLSDPVFRTMATIPMEWVGFTEREGLPFDAEEFFRRLRESDAQHG